MVVLYKDLVISLPSWYLTTSLLLCWYFLNSSRGYEKFQSSKCGRFSSFSFVKTDSKYLFRILVLSWTHTIVLPFPVYNVYKTLIIDFLGGSDMAPETFTVTFYSSCQTFFFFKKNLYLHFLSSLITQFLANIYLLNI